MNLRKAVIHDIDKILLLCKEQFQVMADLQPYLNQDGEQDKMFIESIITDTNSDIFVAEEADEIIGFISVFEKEASDFSFRVKRRYAYVMDIIVTKDFRGNGIATELMLMAKNWALEKGLEYIELTVLANNSAKAFYKKFGFEDTVHTMICKL